MKIVHSPSRMQRAVRALWADGKSIGFVPTMGFLHEGHLSLVRRARRENDRVVASIFVNPLQFGAGEDLSNYPRAPRRDQELLRREGVDLLFQPFAEEFYPPEFSTRVSVDGLEQQLCGRFRPGHFTGVATVVMKLLAVCQPGRLYLGRKDYQQVRVIDRMAADLNLGVDVVVCPTVREKDGLAMSSRNVYLSEEERRWAPELYQALRDTARQIRSGDLRTPEAASRELARRLAAGPGRLQYAEVVGARDLLPVSRLEGELVVALAYFLGRARLIDNVAVRAPLKVGGGGGRAARSAVAARSAGAPRSGRKRGGS